MKMVREIIKKLADSALARLGFPATDFVVEKPKISFGDYAVNAAFGLAKKLAKQPEEIASRLAEKIRQSLPEEIEKIEAVGGYVNFFLSEKFLQNQLKTIHQQISDYGQSDLGAGKLVIVEYSQPNIAKKMHVGHLRTTVLGDALANIYQANGYQVIRWNYLGDWGTQFGNMIAAYKLWGNKEKVEKNPIEALQELYVKFHDQMKIDPELQKAGQEEFKKLEAGDGENLKLWQWFKEESIKEFSKIYQALGVKFDTDIGESFYEKRLKPLVAEMKEDGLLEESGGALIVNLEKENLPPALIQKSDGASLYLTRDIANLKYRLAEYQPSAILYVVGNEQSLHFQQLFAVAKILGLDRARLEHVKYGLVLGEDKKKLSTREGKTIFAEDVIDKATDLAKKIVSEKNPSLAERDRDEIASAVAIGAIKYELLKDHRATDVVFDWQRMLDFSGNSAPYLQYAYARLRNILAKSQEPGIGSKGIEYEGVRELKEKEELALIKQLIEFPEAINQCQQNNLTNPLALYLYELANLANNFYEKVPVLKDENAERLSARLLLVKTAAQTLENGLTLLGLRTLEKI
mgnify:FL=1